MKTMPPISNIINTRLSRLPPHHTTPHHTTILQVIVTPLPPPSSPPLKHGRDCHRRILHVDFYQQMMHNQHFANQRSQQQCSFPITHQQNFLFANRADLPPQSYHNIKHTRTQSIVINHDKDAKTITQPSPGQLNTQKINHMTWQRHHNDKATTTTKPPTMIKALMQSNDKSNIMTKKEILNWHHQNWWVVYIVEYCSQMPIRKPLKITKPTFPYVWQKCIPGL